jgi:DNA invertase Pin-like site-specific DNA recombinase
VARAHPSSGKGGGVRRCAIYTRKSSEEGLEQAFNSLDAQREACEAYIRSQHHEGWTALPARYDDGGLSGGTLERPALQRLLIDIRASRVDLVVVYKVDRLTRSLPDFAKIVEAFDAQSVSFVSITQQFNTTTSMGRLTLNMLLSFAQFEREVTAERIRDKIAASKRKGMWMGGSVPLGYRVHERKLIVEPQEAATVQRIFAGYIELGSVRLLQQQLEQAGTVGKSGQPLGRGPLYHLLQNRIYRGEVSHKGSAYPGQHEAIVDQALWEAVQRRLAEQRANTQNRPRASGQGPLAGLLFDATGDKLVSTYASKGGRRYRYYTSRRLVTGLRADASDAVRVPAEQVERLVLQRVEMLLGDHAGLFGALREKGLLPEGAKDQQRILLGATDLAKRWSASSSIGQAAMLQGLLHRVTLHPEHVEVQIALCALRALLMGDASAGKSGDQDSNEPGSLTSLSIPARLRRTGKKIAIVIDGSGGPTSADTPLARLIAKAYALRQTITKDGTSIDILAQREGVGRTYLLRLLRLAYLAPDIVEAILAGREPQGLTVNRLMKQVQLPIGWTEQRQALGFG